MSWKDEFPCWYQLYQASEPSLPDNYFPLLDEPRSKITTASYHEWEICFARLDADSRHQLFQKAAPYVSRRDKGSKRHWSALFEILNEAKGYNYLQDLNYSTVRFIPKSSSRTPDVCGSASFGDALLEVKTINKSDIDIIQMGTLQKAHSGLPDGLKKKLLSDYTIACDQLHSVPLQKSARRICYFCITLDLPVVLTDSNKQALDDYLNSIQKDCEIYHESRFWRS